MIIDQQRIKQFQEKVDKASHIAIFWHDNPDGDAIWSMLGLGWLLEGQGKHVSYFASPKASVVFDFLPWIEKIKSEFDYSKRYDLIIFVDFSPYTRTLFSAGKYDYFDSKDIVIFDHHMGNTPAHALAIKDEDADSNCEWIFENTKEIWSDYYNAQIATYLYMGIATDTGNFHYDKQGDRSLRNAADLVKFGADKHLITQEFFGTVTLAQLQFFNTALHNLVVHDKIGYVYFTVEDYESLGLDKEQAGGFLIYLITKLQGIDFMMIARHDGDVLKISFRSKNPHMSAEKVARSLWWGWHFYAAWGKIDLQAGEDPRERLELLVTTLPDIFAS